MKKTIKNLLLMLMFLLIFLFLGTINSMASGDLYLNELNFDAKINSDGSMDVVETWNIDIEETNTLFKTFKTDREKYSAITNVKVYETTKGMQKTFTEIKKLMYHVTEECYYGMINDDGDFEIAWGVGLDNSSATKTYNISYTVEDAVSKHPDYAQLYWQFVGEEFGINSDKISGTITLPTNAVNKEDIKVWGHIEDLNGEIYVTGPNKIEFTVNDFNAGRYVEIRSLFPTSMITFSNRTNNIAILDNVIKEETVWVNEANERRARRDFINGLVTVVIDILLILISFVFISNMVKKKKKIKGMKKLKPTENVIYFREMPRKNATPAQATYVYKKIKTEMQSYDIGKVFSATLLHFNLKKVLNFEVNKDVKGKDNISIKLLDRTGSIIGENRDEKAIFDFLLSAFEKNNKEEITVKELQKFIEKQSSKILKLQEKIQSGTKEDLRHNKLLDKKEEKEYEKTIGALVGYIMSVMFSCIFGVALAAVINVYILIGVLPFAVISIINLILTSIELSRINIYTQEGVNESEKWKGLKKYMEEFSMMDKREVPEIAIWEEFLVYATVFGIADKVLKQLKIVYPNFESSIDVNTYSGMYLMMNTDFSISFSNAISSSMSSAYSSASGGGGGFSGGGGGGRWPEEVEVVDNNHFKKYIRRRNNGRRKNKKDL